MIDNEVKIFSKKKKKCCATNFLFTGSMLNRVKIQEKETNLNETMRVFFIPFSFRRLQGKMQLFEVDTSKI